MKKLSLFILLVGLMSVPSCYYDNEEELYPGECDTLQPPTYSGFVVQLLGNNCLACHGNSVAQSNGGGIALEGYANIKMFLDVPINRSRILGAIRHEPGYIAMPQGGSKLSDCNILKFRQWIDAGYPDN